MLESPAGSRTGLNALLGLRIGGGETADLFRSNTPPPVWVLRTAGGGAVGVPVLLIDLTGEGDARGGRGGRVVEVRVGEVGGDMKTSSLSGKFACRRSRVPKILTWHVLLRVNFSNEEDELGIRPQLTSMAG